MVRGSSDLGCEERSVSLFLVHRIVIASGLVACPLFLAYCVIAFRRSGEARLVLLAAASILAEIGFSLYLRWFVRKLARWRSARMRDPGPRSRRA
jgi:hypothetical protein